jgi:hypothetical protein
MARCASHAPGTTSSERPEAGRPPWGSSKVTKPHLLEWAAARRSKSCELSVSVLRAMSAQRPVLSTVRLPMGAMVAFVRPRTSVAQVGTWVPVAGVPHEKQTPVRPRLFSSSRSCRCRVAAALGRSQCGGPTWIPAIRSNSEMARHSFEPLCLTGWRQPATSERVVHAEPVDPCARATTTGRCPLKCRAHTTW